MVIILPNSLKVIDKHNVSFSKGVSLLIITTVTDYTPLYFISV